ncbi:TetR/AcrR family transcriptional regulator [Agromyces sp. H3Y2-19a]|uniref:TetR/AcrR family transcriptional regulator n=1 Tax=Agromyces TaxID=33877 RepID=UPI001E367684|nr:MULTISPECIES: TetR/AcrR family transcriptional regulator [Agromyces]MCD5344873.1 TetR/AcrR family transcriptional regulator [Agromyces sp. S2-1-8]MDF0513944.1 TetR/AcrR family transcriptional regulator [Agromyces chromiiresistens]
MAAEKVQQRKRDLLRAASQVISERGIAGASVRSVAERAEVSSGSVLYHFDSFDHLVETAVRGAIDEFIERRHALVDGITDPVERLRATIEAGIPEVISDDLRITYEASATLRDHPQYRLHMAVLLERQVALYRTNIEVGVALGAFRPRMPADMIASNLVALEDAYDLYLLNPDNWERGRYLECTVRYAELALDCDLGGDAAGGAGDADRDADAAAADHDETPKDPL